MAATRGVRIRRCRFALSAATLAAAGIVGPVAVANAAPVFDVDAYAQCTATTAPAPGQDADASNGQCCAQYAGVPTPTRFGMGCAAPMRADAGPDERPLIVMPSRALPGDGQSDGQDLANLDGLADVPLPQPLP